MAAAAAAARAFLRSRCRSPISRAITPVVLHKQPVSPSQQFSFFGFSSAVRGGIPTAEREDDDHQSGNNIITVDRSGLNLPHAVEQQGHDHSRMGEQSALAKHISALIRFRGGPISIAEFMGEVLTNPNAGFYMNRDVFGSRGDFVTSPDSSQMFGEMLGIWSVLLWEQLGKPRELALVELGPGRGTLMADLIRSTAKFTEFSSAVRIHFVECSPTLRTMQEKALGFASMPKLWHMELQEVPRGVPCVIIAHEFFDALPIHQFQKTSRGWGEKLVDVAENHEPGFRFVLSPRPTPASTLYLEQRLLWATTEEKAQLEHVEVCPQAWMLAQDIARRIAEDGGGALIIDYGEAKVSTGSLQAIRKHQFVNVLEDPGSADLSAYVDFSAIRSAVKNVGGASVYGPVTQSKFLGSLGINMRLERLLNAATSEEQQEALQLGYWILVGDGPPQWLEDDEEEGKKAPMGMGNRYKVLTIVQSGLAEPVGFF
ncbi:unnamed protein product [Calypogeia fissa]